MRNINRIIANISIALILIVQLTSTSYAFTDTSSHWSKSSIDWAIRKGIVEDEDGRFNPDSDVTVSELTRWLYNAYDLRYAIRSPLTELSGNKVTRGEYAGMIYWLYGNEIDINSSRDISKAVKFIANEGLTNNSSEYRPDDYLKKSEAITFIQRVRTEYLSEQVLNTPSNILDKTGEQNKNTITIGNGTPLESTVIENLGREVFLRLDLRAPSNLTSEQINFLIAGRVGESLEGEGQAFVNIEKEHGINALFMLSLGIHESGWGKSEIAIQKNNLFGYGAFDKCPLTCAHTYDTIEEGVSKVASNLKRAYLTEGGTYYNGYTLKGINVKYSSDDQWADGIAQLMSEFHNKLNSEFGYSMGLEGAVGTNSDIEKKTDNIKDNSTATGVVGAKTDMDTITNYTLYKVIKFIIGTINYIVMILAYLGTIALTLLWGAWAMANSGMPLIAHYFQRISGDALDLTAEGSFRDLIGITIGVGLILGFVISGMMVVVVERVVVFIYTFFS